MFWNLFKYIIYWSIKGSLVYSRFNFIDEIIVLWLIFSVVKILISWMFIFLLGILLVIYNLKFLFSGELELDVKIDKEDILIVGVFEEWVTCVFDIIFFNNGSELELGILYFVFRFEVIGF